MYIPTGYCKVLKIFKIGFARHQRFSADTNVENHHTVLNFKYIIPAHTHLCILWHSHFEKIAQQQVVKFCLNRHGSFHQTRLHHMTRHIDTWQGMMGSRASSPRAANVLWLWAGAESDSSCHEAKHQKRASLVAVWDQQPLKSMLELKFSYSNEL